MKKPTKILASTLLSLAAGVCLLVYLLINISLFSANKILITTLATTGPDYKVVFGRQNLKAQLPDTCLKFDLTGVMTTGSGIIDLQQYLSHHYVARFDYFLLTVNVVGVEKSDTKYFHPLIEVSSWKHISKERLWGTVAAIFILFILTSKGYKKYRGLKTSANSGFCDMAG